MQDIFLSISGVETGIIGWLLALVAPLFIVFFLIVYIKKQRLKESRLITPIVALYEPPEVSLVVAGFIYAGYVSTALVVAELLDLVNNGFARIVKNSDGLIFERTSESVHGSRYNQELAQTFFASESNVAMKDFLNPRSNLRIKVNNILLKQVKEAMRSLFEPGSVRRSKKAFVGGIILILIGLVPTLLTPTFVLLGLYFSLRHKDFLRWSKEGLEIKSKVLGYKEYLITVEKDRLAFHYSPKNELIEVGKELPMAVVLGVDGPWKNEFDKIETLATLKYPFTV